VIDPPELAQLRAVVRTLDAANAEGTSLREVVQLARDLHLRSGLTIDFGATSELGQAMVVLRPTTTTSLSGLTPREREVAGLVAAGCSNKEIARRLGLTLGTVKHYVHQILDKTGLRGRVAIAHAHREATVFDPTTPAIFR
jgi:DNA-binding NarL/FixJ family response regulator